MCSTDKKYSIKLWKRRWYLILVLQENGNQNQKKPRYLCLNVRHFTSSHSLPNTLVEIYVDNQPIQYLANVGWSWISYYYPKLRSTKIVTWCMWVALSGWIAWECQNPTSFVNPPLRALSWCHICQLCTSQPLNIRQTICHFWHHFVDPPKHAAEKIAKNVYNVC